jgi:hypothetical protein
MYVSRLEPVEVQFLSTIGRAEQRCYDMLAHVLTPAAAVGF